MSIDYRVEAGVCIAAHRCGSEGLGRGKCPGSFIGWGVKYSRVVQIFITKLKQDYFFSRQRTTRECIYYVFSYVNMTLTLAFIS